MDKILINEVDLNKLKKRFNIDKLDLDQNNKTIMIKTHKKYKDEHWSIEVDTYALERSIQIHFKIDKNFSLDQKAIIGSIQNIFISEKTIDVCFVSGHKVKIYPKLSPLVLYHRNYKSAYGKINIHNQRRLKNLYQAFDSAKSHIPDRHMRRLHYMNKKFVMLNQYKDKLEAYN